MKKFLILTAFIIFSLQAQAYDDYIMTSDKPVKSVKSSDESVVKIRPVFTIDNNKQTIKGTNFPSMITNASFGELFYNTSSNTLYCYRRGKWIPITSVPISTIDEY